MNAIKITCIFENTTFNTSFFAGLGQSLLIEIDNKKYLFDTGELYEGFLYNMKRLNIDFESINDVFLSHNHIDHSGALFKLIDQFTTQRLFLPPDMRSTDEVEDRYDTGYRREPLQEAIQKLLDYKKTIIVSEGMQIDTNLYTTGTLPAHDREQSLVITIPNKGLVLLVGCAHPTLPVIIQRARELTGINKIYGIIGGLHYIRDNDKQIAEKVKYIASLNLEFIVPSHCTGYKADYILQEVLGEKVLVSVTGQFGSGNSLTILPKLEFHSH